MLLDDEDECSSSDDDEPPDDSRPEREDEARDERRPEATCDCLALHRMQNLASGSRKRTMPQKAQPSGFLLALPGALLVAAVAVVAGADAVRGST